MAGKCEICGAGVPRHGHYLVRIDVFADPSMPPINRAELEGIDFDELFEELIDQMKDMSQEQLQDQVHRRFEFRVCRDCQIRLLAELVKKKGSREDQRGQG